MKTLILDRDGVINHDSAFYIKSPEEWHAIPGSLDAIARFNREGFRIFIVTNQSGVGRGFYSLETLDRIHEKLMAELASVGGCIERIYFCPHHPNELCQCRKPNPLLFRQLEKDHDIHLASTFYIGDSATDMEVALTVGCKPLLVLSGNGEKTRNNHPEYHFIPFFNSLADTVPYILSHSF